MAFERRDFLLGSVSTGVFVLLPRCAPAPTATGEPDGTIENPWTEDQPGPNLAEAKLAAPQIYGALVDGKVTRLWVECKDPLAAVETLHPQEQAHSIQELYLRDEFGNEIASLSFPYDAQARLIATVEIPERVTRIDAIAKCSATGYWKRSLSVADLSVPPVGDLQRPYTVAQPGGMDAGKHVPILGKREDGTFAVEVGDRAAGLLHVMEPAHYISHIVVLDDNHQLRLSQALGPAVAEPVVENVPVAGAKKVRVLALCNLHFYWEAEFAIV